MTGLRRALLRGRRDDGATSLELLGLMPLVFVIAALGLQVGAFLWAVTNTNEAVRQGARAESLTGGTGCSAARATLAESLRVLDCQAEGGPSPFTPSYVVIQVEVPVLGMVDPYVPDVTITRRAVLP